MNRHRGRSSSWTEERKAELRRLWGAPLREIGDQLGISHVAVHRQAEAMGLVRPKQTWAKDDPKLIRMVLDGLDNEEVAERLRRTVPSIQARKCALRKLGQLPPAAVTNAPVSRSKPPVVLERKDRKCLRCREAFESQHRGNWICPECAPIVNRLRGAIA